MAMVVATLAAKVTAEGVTEVKIQLEEVGKKAEQAKGHFEGLKNALSMAGGFAIFGGLTAGFGFLKDQFGSVIDLTKEFQLTQAQTAQVLKSTHDVSGMTAEALDNLAEKYGKTTMFSADTVKGGENLLLTFTNIGKKVFPDATQAILDVSQAMGQDLKSSAIQVGKALGDPLTGMTALQRIGVTFSAQEKEQIKTMMAHNDIIGAQKVILHELATEFGGSATAAGKTFQGQWEEIGHTLDADKEKIGGALLPVLGDFLNKYITPLAQKFSDWMTKGGGLQDFQTWLKNAVSVFENQFLPDLNMLLNTYIIPLATAFYNVGTQLVNFVGWLQKGGPAADAVKVGLAGVATVIAGFKVAGFLNDLNTGLGTAITNAGRMKQTFSDFVNWFGSTFFKNFQQTTAEIDAQLVGEGSISADAEAASSSVGGIGSAASGAIGPVGLLAAAIFGLFLTVKADYENYQANVKAGYNTPSSGTQSGVYSTVGRNPNSPNYGNYNGRGTNYIGHHASGILNSPTGHWAMVGEQGPEAMYVPQGSSILPNNMIGNYSNAGGGGQPLILQVDGYQLARILMPQVIQNIRNNVGVVGV